MTRAALLWLLVVPGVIAQCRDYRTQPDFERGVRNYRSASFPAAASDFGKVLEQDPSCVLAKLYLATTYAMWYIPGAQSPENLAHGEKAIDLFKAVLDEDSKNTVSVAAIASVYFNMKKLDEARIWYEKQIQLDPTNPEPYYSVGVIVWSQTYPERMKLKAEHNIEYGAPIKDAKVREPLCAKNLPLIEDAFKNLNKALELRPDYDDAMAYINLMYREKADCQADLDERDRLNKIADTWVDRLMQVKKQKAETAAGNKTKQ